MSQTKTFTPTVADDYFFGVTVTDNLGATSTEAIVLVTVLDPGATGPPTQAKTFTTPWPLGGGTVVLGVTVTDNLGATSAEATVSVTVLAPTRLLKRTGALVPVETVQQTP